ncbi:hypothetical protein [Streptomyces sp. NPDC004528]|uniref:hypothetical protein n=1 Tax=Streptomyces sp. NPDC004528 TaxID=3154550 RepID=UPI0033BC8B9E
MPLSQPDTSQSDTTWTVTGKYSERSATTFQLQIVTEGGADAEEEGDAFLQQLVDVLAGRFPSVAGTKSFTSLTTRGMTPS